MKIHWELFSAFMRAETFTFGGGYAILPLIQKEIVNKKHQATEEEITDYYTVAQCTPGIIIVNTATFIGFYEKGILGAIIVVLGVITPSIIIILPIASVLTTYSSLAIVQHALAGTRVAVCVPVLNAVVKLWKSGIRNTFGILLFTVVLSAIIFISISTVLIVIIAALLGVTVCALRRREMEE